MARLAIRKVIYSGDKYRYESPLLSDGINILEGENGSGKTTFSEMIYFALGGTAKILRQDQEDKLTEIMSDENNYVAVTVLIGEAEYVLTRYIGTNDIAVKHNDTINILPISRTGSSKYVFSDWILEQLDIQPVTLSMGSISWIINFEDLMRLIYHNQMIDPSPIYKQPWAKTFINDSKEMRKAIFEILIGKIFQEYYSASSSLKEMERRKEQAVGALNLYVNTLNEIQKDQEDLNVVFLKKKIEDETARLEKLVMYRKSLSEQPLQTKKNSKSIDDAKNELINYEFQKADLVSKRNSLLLEISKFQQVKNELILETAQIKKMIFAHEQLELFSADTCPYCLKEITRKKDHCVCGSQIKEEEYERFFYSTKEYIDILKSKQKNIETIESAVKIDEKDLVKSYEAQKKIEKLITDQKKKMRDAIGDYGGEIDVAKFETVDQKIVELKSQIATLDQQFAFERKRQSLESEVERLSGQVDRQKKEVERLMSAAETDIQEKTKIFSQKYKELTMATISNCRSAIINDNYLPVLNNGDHLEASADVAKRLMYYIVLLYMSLQDAEIKFPRFLLVDTPDTAGIDAPVLIQCLSMISKVAEETKRTDYQVILTTGFNKYPTEYKQKIFRTISKADRLLQPVAPKSKT